MSSNHDTSVDLWTARIPGLGRFAEHHWFVVCRERSADRWEVWQTATECETSWGHLHRNLMRPSSGVGNCPGRMIHRWTADDAVYLATRIESTPTVYPWNDRYRIFPGPNSNTYVQWVLGPLYTLGWRGFGRRYASPSRLAKIWENHAVHRSGVSAFSDG
ncbi:DUF3750 domain-containing protein [Allorhodopirellula heiligendammensis]|uniref:DUF3750 domain-containing protein n=1 Tax=Allorhodopirellula heiligendammensis TaxID=2714739 RepID=A0A5C6B1T3_9BACT|nr:DUF3750 domain-containing protein [Allorhodopirellula heiligendammensis]TWU05439.1 hypothetical protein Poly21_56460 [Allorhodopirellula heiligendammensis]